MPAFPRTLQWPLPKALEAERAGSGELLDCASGIEGLRRRNRHRDDYMGIISAVAARDEKPLSDGRGSVEQCLVAVGYNGSRDRQGAVFHRPWAGAAGAYYN